MSKYKIFAASFIFTLIAVMSAWAAAVVFSACESRIHGGGAAFELQLSQGDSAAYLTAGNQTYRIVLPAPVDHPELLPTPLRITEYIKELLNA